MTATEATSPPPRTDTPVLEAKGLVKRYGPVTAIVDSDLELYLLLCAIFQKYHYDFRQYAEASLKRRVTAALIAHLVELEARRLYLPAGYPSLFIYCVRALRLSGGGAYNRIEVARVARAFPAVLGLLEEGALNLATVRLLAPLSAAAPVYSARPVRSATVSGA